MPQMMPLSWLTLFFMFSAALVIFATTNFYTYIPSMFTTKSKIKVNPVNWKW
uniref:ATP synthase complex subunit 8 n=1 Tax=Calcaritermes sp. TaxID=2942753 RepID=A0A8X8RGN0_9NEOP|nr:ATP synthase F0 subunit 8 [Calcaritermes sp.]URX53348.1 ATP synthase F0 subunit 8 [Calcaritermes sp.]